MPIPARRPMCSTMRGAISPRGLPESAFHRPIWCNSRSIRRRTPQHTEIGAIANALWDLSERAPSGCLIYFTSHGAYDKGIVVDDDMLAPDKFAIMVNNACGSKPSVIVMSACFSGQFVPALAGDNRMIFTAARPDRTSFGCGESDHYTFFDTCFLESLPQSGDFPGLWQETTTACVSKREHDLGAALPSEPQREQGGVYAQVAVTQLRCHPRRTSRHGRDAREFIASAYERTRSRYRAARLALTRRMLTHRSRPVLYAAAPDPPAQLPSSLRPPARRGCRRRDRGGLW